MLSSEHFQVLRENPNRHGSFVASEMIDSTKLYSFIETVICYQSEIWSYQC